MKQEHAFRYPLDTYRRDFDFHGNYKRQMAIGLSISEGISEEEALYFINEEIESGRIMQRDPSIHCTHRQQNGDRIERQVAFSNYFKMVDSKQLGMSPTLTTYLPPSVVKSFTAESIADDMKERSAKKKLALAAKQKGDKVTNMINNGLQNAIKVFINSWSGASLDKTNAFFCRSKHPSLTSMCRITTATCTAIAERFVAGKRYYYNIEVIFEDILFTLDTMKPALVHEAMRRYKLHYPTTEEVNAAIRRSALFYILDASALIPVEEFVAKLSPLQKAAVLYTVDFQHLAKYNDEFARGLVDAFTTVPTDGDAAITDYSEAGNPLKGLNGDQVIMVSNLLQDDIAGQNIWEIDLTAEENKVIRAKICMVVGNLLNGLQHYQTYINAFLRVDWHPLHLATQANAIRLAVPLGDTDSTLITTKLLSEWYYGHAAFTRDQEPVQDWAVYFICQLFEHFLGMFVAQMGVAPENRDLLVMKNEYKMPILMLTPVAKTYQAYASPEYELKGQRFHASKHTKSLIDSFHKLLKDNLGVLRNGGKIDRGAVVDMVCTIEEDIKEQINSKESPYFLNVKVKDKDNYKQPYQQNYVHYPLWEKVFSSRYGAAPELEYTAVKVPVLLDKSAAKKAWVESLPEDMRKAFQEWQTEYGKENSDMTNILVPLANLRQHGMPREIREIVNFRRIVADVLDPHYLYLQTMGIFFDYKDQTKLLSEVIPLDLLQELERKEEDAVVEMA
jgi:hypothetical protein